MKVAIIGAGNMGGAIARGLAQGTIIPASDVTVADPFSGSLETLQADYPEINVTTENPKAIKDRASGKTRKPDEPARKRNFYKNATKPCTARCNTRFFSS